MPRTVWIINSSRGYERMFYEYGWEIITELPKAFNLKNLLIQFTGGSDVSPSFYGEAKHYTTNPDSLRDKYENSIVSFAQNNSIPMAGICRGGQFLHVMNGGRLYQDVDNHAIYGTHEMIDVWTRKTYQVTSTHHQMIRENQSHTNILIAYANGLASYKTYYPLTKPDKGSQTTTKDKIDIECLFYPRTRSLCFQPHPELDHAKECRDVYFDYIDEYIFNGEPP